LPIAEAKVAVSKRGGSTTRTAPQSAHAVAFDLGVGRDLFEFVVTQRERRKIEAERLGETTGSAELLEILFGRVPKIDRDMDVLHAKPPDARGLVRQSLLMRGETEIDDVPHAESPDVGEFGFRIPQWWARVHRPC
jgi:hypothetical protein